MLNKVRTVSYTLPWDNAPVDISFVFENEKPAGIHGFVTQKEDKFVFEDGTAARFWGTNFNSAANFPSHEYSDMVAKRLAKFGLNLVRFHQMDGDWSTPNIFQFTKGKRLNDTMSLDPESMDRLDYLIYALKKEGIYVYMDMLTYRRFRTGDGARSPENLADGARPASNFDPVLIQRQKEFCSQIWERYNPYTKLKYCDDPVFAMMEIVNENELLSNYSCKFLTEPYRTELENMYQEWRQKKDLVPETAPVDLASESNAELMRFKMEMQARYFEDMYNYLRKIGVKIPIAGTTWKFGFAASQQSQTKMDFMDVHPYHYNWGWKPEMKLVDNRSMLAHFDPWYNAGSFMRLANKPFFISEWDVPWPNPWRAECVLNLAAVSALQGWGGTAIHTYRYDCRPNVDMIAEPITGDALAGVPYRSGVFDTFNDPAKFGLFYHAALIMRRGDVAESRRFLAVPYKGIMASDRNAELPDGKDHILCQDDFPALDGAAEVVKIGTLPEGVEKPAHAELHDGSKRIVPGDAVEFVSESGELYRNSAKKLAYIDTERTKAAYGFLGAAGEIKLKNLKIKCENPFAVIALSSLTDAPLTESDNILLTAVGRADNTDTVYNNEGTVQYSKGHGPVQAEVIAADIELESSQTGFHVEAITSHGMHIGRTEVTEKDGKVSFHIGGTFASIYYLIQKM